MKAYELMNSGLPKNYEKWRAGVALVGFVLYCCFLWINAGWLKEALPGLLGLNLMYYILLCIIYYNFLQMFLGYLDRKYRAWREALRQEVVEDLWDKDPAMMKMFEAKIETIKSQLTRCDQMQEKVDEHRNLMRKEMEKIFKILSIHAIGNSIIRGIRDIGAQRGIL